MKKTFTFISLFLVLNMFSQEGKIFFETNFNTFSQSSLKDFQQEFKVDLHPIPIKTVDDFPANIGFTAGYEITESNIALFLSYNSTGGKLSYSDYSGSVKIEESLNAITFGGIYYIDLNKERKVTGEISVKCMTLRSLLRKYEITEIGFFKVDTEGHDHIIMHQLLELMDEGLAVTNKILFEYNHLSDKQQLDKISDKICELYGFSKKYIPNNVELIKNK